MDTQTVFKVLADTPDPRQEVLALALRALDAQCDLAEATLAPDELYEYVTRLLEWGKDLSSTTAVYGSPR